VFPDRARPSAIISLSIAEEDDIIFTPYGDARTPANIILPYALHNVRIDMLCIHHHHIRRRDLCFGVGVKMSDPISKTVI